MIRSWYSRVMIFRHEYRGGVWVDLEQPSESEVLDIAKEFSMSDRIQKEILTPTPLPIVAVDEGVTLLVLHFSAYDTEQGGTGNQEIDFIVGDHFIVTVRYEVIAPLYHLKKLLEAQKLVAGRGALTTEILLEVLFAHLYTSVRDHTNHIATHLERVEQDMFNGHEHMTVREISNVNREFLHIEASLANQEGPLTRFLKALAGERSFGTAFPERTERILAERAQVARLVQTHRAVGTELRETNSALLETRQNEIMKTLTIITVIVFPLELIAVIFGMHLPGTPLEENPYAFFIVLTGMFGIVVLMTLFFARKRWIF